MNVRNFLLVLGLLIGVGFSHLGATQQMREQLILNGDTLPISGCWPLQRYFASGDHYPKEAIRKYGYQSTNCWRGYVGYWELRNDSLFLTRIKGERGDIDLSLIFPDRQKGEPVFAEWFSGSAYHYKGRSLFLIQGYDDCIYEYETEYCFVRGRLLNLHSHDNRQTIVSPYLRDPELLLAFLKNNIDYTGITDPEKPARVIVLIRGATPEGKVDDVEVIRGCDPERDREAVRLVRSIPQWIVLYWHGKRYPYFYTLPIRFGKELQEGIRKRR